MTVWGDPMGSGLAHIRGVATELVSGTVGARRVLRLMLVTKFWIHFNLIIAYLPGAGDTLIMNVNHKIFTNPQDFSCRYV